MTPGRAAVTPRSSKPGVVGSIRGSPTTLKVIILWSLRDAPIANRSNLPQERYAEIFSTLDEYSESGTCSQCRSIGVDMRVFSSK